MRMRSNGGAFDGAATGTYRAFSPGIPFRCKTIALDLIALQLDSPDNPIASVIFLLVVIVLHRRVELIPNDTVPTVTSVRS